MKKTQVLRSTWLWCIPLLITIALIWCGIKLLRVDNGYDLNPTYHLLRDRVITNKVTTYEWNGVEYLNYQGQDYLIPDTKVILLSETISDNKNSTNQKITKIIFFDEDEHEFIYREEIIGKSQEIENARKKALRNACWAYIGAIFALSISFMCIVIFVFMFFLWLEDLIDAFKKGAELINKNSSYGTVFCLHSLIKNLCCKCFIHHIDNMNLVHDIPTFSDRKKGYINIVIDVPKGSNNKYEYDHKLGCFKLDRVIHESMFYPVDYGFIPQTLSLDGDPCDVCLLVTNPTFTGCLIKARPIGILYTSDNAGDDPKIIAVPTSDVDPRWDEVKSVDDLGHHMKEELFTIFKQIKFLEHDKYDKVEVKEFGSIDDANNEILTSMHRYQKSLKSE